MSDAMSDLAQDGRISKETNRLLVSEKALLEKLAEGRGKYRCEIREVMDGWADYSNLRRGYNLTPKRSLAKRNLVAWKDFLDEKIDYSGLKKYLGYLGSDKLQSRHFYFAVVGHGGIMGNTERIFEEALAKKFGTVPHSFNAIVDEDGKIDFERVSCAKCRLLGYCNMEKDCNCYNRNEFDKGSRRVRYIEKKFSEFLDSRGQS